MEYDIQTHEASVLPTNAEFITTEQIVAAHNVDACIEALSEEQMMKVAGYLFVRGLWHIFGTEVGYLDETKRSSTILIANMPSEHMDQLIPLANWFRQNIGINVVIGVNGEASETHTDGVNVVAMNGSQWESLVSNAVWAPYIVTEAIAEHPYIGGDVEGVRTLEDKGVFHKFLEQHQETIQTIAATFNGRENLVLEYEIVRGVELGGLVPQLLRKYEAMLSEAQYVAKASESELIKSICPGCVLRLRNSGGTYGTVIIVENGQGGFDVQVDGEDYSHSEVEGYTSASQIINHLISEGRILDAEEYVVTRFIDSEAPSVGVYFYQDRVFALPVTHQIVQGSKFIGGGTMTDTQMSKMGRDMAIMQYVGEWIVGQLVALDSERGTNFGHIGFDFLKAREAEQALCEVVLRNDSLRRKYGRNVTNIALTESNPRHTSISLGVWPVVHYWLSRTGGSGTAVRLRDILMFYGIPDERGRRAAFCTYDYIETENYSNVREVIDLCEAFNRKFENQGIVLLPKLTVQGGNGSVNTTAVTLAVIPTKNVNKLKLFREINKVLQRGLKLDNLETFI